MVLNYLSFQKYRKTLLTNLKQCNSQTFSMIFHVGKMKWVYNPQHPIKGTNVYESLFSL